MRHEVMQLMQFTLGLLLLVGAFALGVLAGWSRWGSGAGASRGRRFEQSVAGRGSASSPTRRAKLFAPDMADDDGIPMVGALIVDLRQTELVLPELTGGLPVEE